MMPNTSVRPAASRNSSSPNCSPFRNCSTTRSMPLTSRSKRRRQNRSGAAAMPSLTILGRRCFKLQANSRPFCPLARNSFRSFHRALVVEAVLVVLDDGGNRLQRELAVGVLDHILQVEILDRDVVVAIFESAAQRLEVGLLHLGFHRVL